MSKSPLGCRQLSRTKVELFRPFLSEELETATTRLLMGHGGCSSGGQAWTALV